MHFYNLLSGELVVIIKFYFYIIIYNTRYMYIVSIWYYHRQGDRYLNCTLCPGQWFPLLFPGGDRKLRESGIHKYNSVLYSCGSERCVPGIRLQLNIWSNNNNKKSDSTIHESIELVAFFPPHCVHSQPRRSDQLQYHRLACKCRANLNLYNMKYIL